MGASEVKQQQGEGVFGSFASPMGVTMSQGNPDDNFISNGLQNCSFSGFGQCSRSSIAVVLVANKAGGYWNSATFVKGLRFASGTRRFWATPNPPSGSPPPGGLLANMYALRDLDGSLLGHAGYAVAPFAPILPPSTVRGRACTRKSDFSVYSCQDVCYRTVGLAYQESGMKKGARPYSSVLITRLEDGAQFTAYGTGNDGPSSSARTVNRFVTASLLSEYSYTLTVVPAASNKKFYPQQMRVVVYDQGGCQGRVNVMVDVPKGKKWVADVPGMPCSNTRDPTRTFQEYQCLKSKPKLSLSIGPSASATVARLNLVSASTTSCTSKSACSRGSSTLPSIKSSPINEWGSIEAADSGTGGNVDPFFDQQFVNSTLSDSTNSSALSTIEAPPLNTNSTLNDTSHGYNSAGDNGVGGDITGAPAASSPSSSEAPVSHAFMSNNKAWLTWFGGLAKAGSTRHANGALGR
eukprot:TRINITY_DN17225_c0_g1_i2.p1 TRINITY_DN17225_c0_g1~~TRINITY_DN17225_c0_g1_i2.p1  ORF type:complete len:511 (+),score=16.24 TRINITY_DN17225_c0_g1_i2:141-1535(+)